MFHDFIKRVFGLSETIVLGNTLVDWISAAVVVSGVWFVLWLLRRIVASRYKEYIADDRPTALRLVTYLARYTQQFLFIAIALYAAEEILNFPPRIQRFSTNVMVVLFFLQVGIWAGRALQFYLDIKRRRASDMARELASSLDIIRFVSLLLIWSVVILVALDNLGVNITALLAGLGVGGVAVALALQSILGDIFASLSIALDKPFVVGDSLVIDTCVGTVERIGIKTTRLRSESGEQIIMSNADILKSRVRNFGSADERRAVLTLNVAPDAPIEKLREIPDLVAQIVQRQADSRFDRCHLKTLGDWALQFEVSFFTRNAAEHPLLDMQQSINLAIIDEFRQRGIGFALPARRIYSQSAEL